MYINSSGKMVARTDTALNVVFVHPDLGIGGAERLVIDAAVGLQSIGHKVTILTSYRDKKHCFQEARDGESLINATSTLPINLTKRIKAEFDCSPPRHS